MSMKKKLLIIGCLLGACAGFNMNMPAYCGFQEHYTLAQQHFFNARYASAIDEFKKALMINFMDNSARIGIINSYNARGTFLVNKEHNYKAAADDFKCALFYLKYYVDKELAMSAYSSIESTQKSLDYCEKFRGADTSAEGHYKMAEEYNDLGNFPASMYEYEQIANDNKYRKTALVRIASMMKSINNLIKSAEYYQKAIETDPNDMSIRMRYAAVLNKMGNAEEASNQYNYVLSHCENETEVLYELERIYQKRLEQNPNNAELLADIGAIKQRQGKYEEAFNYYKTSLAKPVRDEKTTLNTQINLGTLLQAQQKYEGAMEIYKNIITLYPNNYLANLYLAQCYEAKPETKKLAIEQYKKLKQIKPDNQEFSQKIGELTRASMTSEDLYNYVRSYKEPEKYYVDELYTCAYNAHKNNDFETAIKYYTEVKRVDNREDLYENLAMCYAQKKNYEKAKEILAEAKEKYPNSQNISKLLAGVNEDITAEVMDNAYAAYNSQNYNKAIELYQSLPETTDTLLGLAATYQGMKNDDVALDYYKRALAKSPSNADIAYSIGALYANAENYSEAKNYFEKAVKINPDNTMAKDALLDMTEVLNQNAVSEASKLVEKEKYYDALILLNKVLEDDPKNADAYYYKASIYDIQKKYQHAIDNYKKSLEYNPNQDVTYYLIAIDYENLNSPKTALGYYKKFLERYKTDDEYSQYVKARIPEIENGSEGQGQ